MVNAIARPITQFHPQTVFGVDFSGAAMAGENAWIAELQVVEPGVTERQFAEAPGVQPARKSSQPNPPALKLINLRRLGDIAGSSDRATICKFLAQKVLASRSVLWGMDFPFGLPIELGLGDWPCQLRDVCNYSGDAKSYGRELVETARRVGDAMHIRRETDRETKTPFDCYHYRIIYQTFHGMRDVLAKIAGADDTFVMPFDCERFCNRNVASDGNIRVVLEACPSSTLKRCLLPHQMYKQAGGKPPDELRRLNRKRILSELTQSIEISAYRRRVMMRNPGGDALDAVIAGFGAWSAWQRDDPRTLHTHPRYRLEGRVYC